MRRSRVEGLLPNRPVDVVRGKERLTLQASEILAGNVGQKAFGLLCSPAAWVPVFFVVDGTVPLDEAAITAAAEGLGLTIGASVYVRSNGTLEGIEQRGSLDSAAAEVGALVAVMRDLQSQPVWQQQAKLGAIHFIVQAQIEVLKKGHLSNERRLNRHTRDWSVEVVQGEVSTLGVRKWRDASTRRGRALKSATKIEIYRALRSIAAWVGKRRAHVEWVWDGKTVWLVQLDELMPKVGGSHPDAIVAGYRRADVLPGELKAFRVATSVDMATYKKLANAKLYESLGYIMPPFYVLSNHYVRQLLSGHIPQEVADDLKQLCGAPFVLRTDAVGLAHDKRQMLPRSDELRSQSAAIEWLRARFSELPEALAEAEEVVLIGHHFIPAAASAWSSAYPDKRAVRIESLWGIPEGLYYFAHDVKLVDTAEIDASNVKPDKCRVAWHRERYKEKFIAPDESGAWRVQRTTEGPDWSPCIPKQEIAAEIAAMSRRIAAAHGAPVVVMWFIDVAASATKSKIIPWYHEDWKGQGAKASPVHKTAGEQTREIAKLRDYETLRLDVASGTRVARVLINPEEGDLVRKPEFLRDFAAHAKANGYVIELSGGLLSHAYYMLTKEGCIVECVDLVDSDDDLSEEFNKLVRDNIPRQIEARGEEVVAVQLSGDALIECLKRKVVEEALEVTDAVTIDAISDEIADLLEVVDALKASLSIREEQIDEARQKKRIKRGAFEAGVMLIKTAWLKQSIGGMLPEEPQLRIIDSPEHLPSSESGIHIDSRVDAQGIPERQVTLTLPLQEQTFDAGGHRLDIVGVDGQLTRLFLSASTERTGAKLQLRLRIANAVQQLTLPFEDP
jgi:predicted house-cleaning noncanonical NTP pyrophosphatase (MazG superfamily)